MKKINFEVFNYLLFSLFALISILSLLYVNYFQTEWTNVLNFLIPVSGCFGGGWIAFSLIFLPTFQSYRLLK